VTGTYEESRDDALHEDAADAARELRRESADEDCAIPWKRSPWFAVAVKIADGRATAIAGTWLQDGEPTRGGVITVDPAGTSAPSFPSVASALLARMHKAEVIVAYDAPRVLGALEREFTGAGLLSKWLGIVASGERVVIDPLVLVRLKRVGRFWKSRWDGERRHDVVNVASRLQVVPADAPGREDVHAILAGRVLWHLCEHLPDDAIESACWLAGKREEQNEDHREYLAQLDADRNTHQRGDEA